MIKYLSVSKFYNKIPAVSDVSFSIDEGEFVFMTGHSGSGKTTLIKMLIREIEPSEGKIFVEEDDITNMRRWNVAKLRRKIGVVFQDFKLLDEKNVFENVAFALEAGGKSDKEIKNIVPYVLEIVGLKDKLKSFPYELSGGQKQKVAIARAIANDPKILIADEPTGNLDEQATWEIVNILQNINKWGTTVIMSTHGVNIIERLKQRVLTIEGGKLVSDSKAGETEILNKFSTNVLEENSLNQTSTPIIIKSELELPETQSPLIIQQIKSEETIPEKEISEEKNDKAEEPVTQEIEKNPAEDQKIEEIDNSKKRKIKIGLSKNKSKVEQKDNSFESNSISKNTTKLLLENNYKNMQDLVNSGMEKIKFIDSITGDQILEIEQAISKFIK